MGKKSDKKKIRTIEIQIHKGDFKNLRDIAEMIGYDSVEEYIEDAIVRVATADYNMITMLAEDHLTRMHDKVCSLFSDMQEEESEEAEDEEAEENEEDDEDEEEAGEKEAESEEKEVVEAEASEEAAPVKEVPHKTTRRAKKEEKVEEAAAEAPAEKTEA
ncbi:MAG TPA: hypothetical protein IAA02_08065 [Candidatus Sutterella merdavium]|nr:hypothetical protein [Candidatus Sutterella merdavium]